MKRILWVNGWPGVGGAERAQLALFQRLRETYEITAVVPQEATPGLTAEMRKLDIVYFHAPLTQLRQTINPWALSSFALRLAKANKIIGQVIQQRSIDLVHFAYLYDIPFAAPVAHHHKVPGFWLIENPERFNWVNRGITNACSLKAFAGTSRAIFDAALQAGLHAPIQEIMPNAYNEDYFFPPVAHNPQKPRALRIGFAGGFNHRKGVLELCRAFVILSQEMKKTGSLGCELWLAGDGEPEYKKEMGEVLHEPKAIGAVKIFDQLESPEQMRGFYHSLDMYVMLSKREGLSVAMLEALACGLPSAILSPWGDDVIENGKTGLILKSDRPEDVALALWPLMGDQKKREEMGRRAAIHARENYSSRVVAEKLSGLYQRILSGHEI